MNRDSREPKTLNELFLMSVSAAIREKPDWDKKMKDETIFSKWKTEAGASDEMMDYIRDELNWYLTMRDGSMEIAGVDGTWQADGLIPEELTVALSDGVAKLENVPESMKDYHPGTNNQVNFLSF